MLTKDQIIRLIMIMDEALEDDVVAHDLELSSMKDNTIQCEMFGKEDLLDYHKEKVRQARNTIEFDEGLREMLVEGLRTARFCEEAEQLLKSMGESIKGKETLPNGMGKVLLFRRRA